MSTTAFSLTFLLMIGLMLLGLPIAVSMVLVGAGAGVLVFGVPFLSSTGSMLWGVLNDNLLTAAPLFILLGELLLRSGMADRMYGAMAAWLSRLPGGLLHTNIACCALFAATSGSSWVRSRCRRCSSASTRCRRPWARSLPVARWAS
jgi:C4-dicarboxylate transporter DctM subunit